MKQWTPKKVFRLLVVGFVGFVFLSTVTTEYQGKWALRKHAKAGTSLAHFKTEYGEPRYGYRNWESLPQAYQQLFGEPAQSEETYYAYQMEGLPSYWSFVVSVDSETQTVQRYIYWRASALKPRQGF